MQRIRNGFPDPFEKPALTYHRNPIRACFAQLVGRPPIIQQRPAEFAHNKHLSLSGDRGARRSAMLADDVEGFCPAHAGEAARKGDAVAESRAIHFNNGHRVHSRLRRSDSLYRFAFFLAGRRTRVLGAGAFFSSASTLARRASIRFTTRGGVISRGASIFSPACFRFNKSMRAFSYRSSNWAGSKCPDFVCTMWAARSSISFGSFNSGMYSK